MTRGYAAPTPDAPLEPIEYDLGPLGPDEVEIRVEHCGVCHSDLSMWANDWSNTTYPFVPGHEVIGTVAALGDRARGVDVGQRVGLGWHTGYCLRCTHCLRGDHNMCVDSQSTIVGRHGGFADTVRARAHAVFPLPAGLDPRSAGPLFCGGITVFNPFVQFGISPLAHVGVVGIGGLGHLALQFARAWGCHVTAFTSTPDKRDQALALGAHRAVDSRDRATLAGLANRFDLILSTVNVPLDWNAYIAALRPHGRLHLVGGLLQPLDVLPMPLLFGQRAISSSPVGGPAAIRDMLEFAARHAIRPTTEHFPLDRVNDALAHLRDGHARYRVVLDV